MRSADKQEIKTQKDTTMTLNFKSVIALASLCGAMLIATSCETPKEKRLKAENEELKNEIVKADSLQLQFMNAYNEIDANLHSIKVREKMINRNSRDAEQNADVQKRIIADIVQIGKLMENNRKKLQEMEGLRRQLASARAEAKKYKEEAADLRAAAQPKQESNEKDLERIAALEKENARLAELNKGYEKTIEGYKKKLADAEATIESMKQEIQQLKDAAKALNDIIAELKASEQKYLAQLDEKDATISDLNNRLSQSEAVYYICAPAKQLKASQIVGKSGLNPDVKVSALTLISDKEEFRSIETKSSKAVFMSTHPAGSYKFNVEDKKNVKIEITNPKAFWSVSRVCVVSTK